MSGGVEHPAISLEAMKPGSRVLAAKAHLSQKGIRYHGPGQASARNMGGHCASVRGDLQDLSCRAAIFLQCLVETRVHTGLSLLCCSFIDISSSLACLCESSFQAFLPACRPGKGFMTFRVRTAGWLQAIH